MRSPSGTASGSSRGLAPVAISTTSAATVVPPASIVCAPVSSPPGPDDPDPLGGHMLGDVMRLRGGQRLDPRVQGGRVHFDHGVVPVRELQA